MGIFITAGTKPQNKPQPWPRQTNNRNKYTPAKPQLELSNMGYMYSTKITSLTLGSAVSDGSKATIVEEGQERSSPGKRGVFRVDLRDSCGLPRHEGGEMPTVNLRLAGGDGTVFNVDKVVDKLDGIYLVDYVMDYPGKYEILVAGDNVAGTILVE